MAKFPFDIISFDLYGGLPISNNGHVCVLSVVGHFSGFTFAKALKDQSASTTSKALAKVFFNYGILNAVSSGNGQILFRKLQGI